MALMKFREDNQVQWIGARPAHRGTQVLARETAVNATVVVYTVPAGKTFYLCAAAVGLLTTTDGFYWLYVRDAGAVRVFDLDAGNWRAGVFAGSLGTAFWPPMELPTGYSIVLQSTVVALTVSGNVFGWVE